MAKHENRWQLLLVADDGRIIPFKRIRGMVLTLIILLVLLGLICAGLAWQLTAEKVRHRRTADQLADADRQMAHFKSQHELIAAELVLAEARMEKAGLLIPRRRERTPQPAPLKTVDADAALNANKEAGEENVDPSAAGSPTPAGQAPDKTDAKPASAVVEAAAPRPKPSSAPPEPSKPAVAIGGLEMKHNAGKKILLARFRVKNTGPRSSPVAGRCVVVLKNGGTDSTAWLAMPSVTLVDGKPDGKQGQAFRISNFRDMEIKAVGQTDPSSFTNAIVYVFDTAGVLISAKDYSINLPAPEPVPAPASQPAPVPMATDDPPVPVQLPAANVPVIQPASDEASGSVPAANPSGTDAGKTLPPVPDSVPVDDPSLTDAGIPAETEDTRSRF
jgi:hypothetical protein